MSRRAAWPGQRLRDALRDVAAMLDDLGRPAMIMGGIAVIAHGVARLTRDIDIAVAGADVELPDLVRVAASHGIEARIPDAIDFARANQVLLLRHVASRVDVDVSLAWAPFEIEAIALAPELRLRGIRLRLARAEDLVVFKLVGFREQDRLDVEELVRLHGDEMDLTRIAALVAQVAEALEDPGRATWLAELLARRRPG